MDPLLNSLILSNAFQQLPLDEKKSFRQVSPLWEDSTLQSWRNNALVKIVKERIETNSNSSLDSDDTSEAEGITLQEFVELLKGDTEPYRFSETKPFRSFQLKQCPFHCPPYKAKVFNQALVNFLFEKIGPNIHHLELGSSVSIRIGRIMDAFKWILLKACVNLKELQINPCILPDMYQSEPPLSPGDFAQNEALNLVTLKLTYLGLTSPLGVRDEEAKEFWNIIPNLKNLGLINTSGELTLDLITQLKHPLDSGKFIKLEQLKFQSDPTDFARTNEIEQIVEMTSYIKAANPPLTRICLKLNLCEIRNAQDSFKAFLDSCKDTLTSLSVLLNEKNFTNQSEPKDFITELSGVTLPNLTCLYFHYENDADEEFEDSDEENELESGTRNFDFGALQGFPKLKKLTVQLCGFGDVENEFACGKWLTEGKLQYANSDEEQSGDDNLVRNKFLEDFTFWSFQQFDCDSFKKLAVWMPSIKCLAVKAYETTLPVILNSFSDIKRLSLLSGSYVSRNTLQKMKRAYPGIEIDVLDFNQSLTKCEMPEYF